MAEAIRLMIRVNTNNTRPQANKPEVRLRSTGAEPGGDQAAMELPPGMQNLERHTIRRLRMMLTATASPSALPDPT